MTTTTTTTESPSADAADRELKRAIVPSGRRGTIRPLPM